MLRPGLLMASPVFLVWHQPLLSSLVLFTSELPRRPAGPSAAEKPTPPPSTLESLFSLSGAQWVLVTLLNNIMGSVSTAPHLTHW
jgi:hypothetical protein